MKINLHNLASTASSTSPEWLASAREWNLFFLLGGQADGGGGGGGSRAGVGCSYILLFDVTEL